MNLWILIIEDSNLKDDISAAIPTVEASYGLAARGITLIPSVVQVTSKKTFLLNCESVAQQQSDPRIVIIDLDLCQKGLSTRVVSALHNATLPKHLHFSDTDRDRQKAGGYLIAWHALASRSKQQIIVFGTGQATPAPIRTRMEAMQTSLGVSERYDFLDGGFDQLQARTEYLKVAVGKWLTAFGSARERLFPVQAQTWFTTSLDVPHKHAHVTDHDRYRRAICEYLSRALQVNEDEVYGCWDRCTDVKKAGVHDYLKGFVGGCARAHVDVGQRLQWKHIAFLAVASAPAPGKWIFDDNLFESGDEDILNADCVEHSKFLDLLVGDTTGSKKGLLPQLLVHDENPKQTTLVDCTPANGSCTITVAFDVHNGKPGRSSLAQNFDEAVRQGRPSGHDVSDALYELHGFLVRCNAGVQIPTAKNAIILSRP